MSLAALQDLFARVRAGATGVWTLGHDPHRIIYLEDGRIVFAQSTHPLDRLTHLLVEKGKLTQAQMDYAMDNLSPGLSIGRNLIQMGFITQRDLLDIARFQVERVVSGALGSEGLDARFEARDLDGSVVRLALDTPALLLGGLLNLRDRERLLELLGPLEQALVLESPPREASLPPDLARVPSLLDGRRSLLDLAREAGTEPMRLGAFALFLRELGWARPASVPGDETPALLESLPEVPALDEDLLVVEAPPAARPVPGFLETQPVPKAPETAAEPPPRRSSLIEHIQAAQLPTANLDHMAEQLDSLSPPAPLPPRIEPPRPGDDDEITAENPVPPLLPESHADAAWHVEEGQALLPEPAEDPGEAPEVEASPAPALEALEPLPEPFPVLPVAPEAGAAPDFTPRPRKRRKRAAWLLALPFVAVVVLGLWLFRGGPASVPPPESPGPAPIPPPAESPGPGTVPGPPKPARPGADLPAAGPGAGPGIEATALPAPAPPPSPAPSPAPGPKTQPPAPGPAPSPAPEPAPKLLPAEVRWTALRTGRLDSAIVQGRSHVRALPGARWTLRLVIACQGETLQNAAGWLSASSRDVFIVPMAMRNGQSCNQLFLGTFASKAEAEAEIPRLPAQFREGGNKPRPYQVSEIPSRQ